MNKDTLSATAAAMVATGKGILAIDESLPTIKKRFDAIGVESTEESRRAWRELLIACPDGAKHISGMILFDETLRQSTADGTPFPKALADQGMLPGIKVDAGAKDFAGHPGEKITEGLDGLRGRLDEYAQLGAKFAKWRAVIAIGAGIPSDACIHANAHALARYAALCQEAGIVPMVEPEVLMDADNTIETCFEITRKTLHAAFNELDRMGVFIQGTILKCNMVVSGKQCPEQADAKRVADLTVRCLLESVPAALPGIVFLSGGQAARDATVHLDFMNKRYPDLPWPLSFSYGRALQEPSLKAWAGKPENMQEAQGILAHREKCNGLASIGQYEEAME